MSLKQIVKNIYVVFTHVLPYGRVVRETMQTQTPIKWRYVVWQKVFGFNRHAYWPVHFSSMVGDAKNILCGIETCPGYMPGCYIQSAALITLGDYTQIAANVGIITQNHDVYENKNHVSAKPVTIGKYGWIGMNSVILPGVVLGDYTIVGAGSVVTKSFSDGYCVIAGNPAKIIRTLDKKECKPFRSIHEYNGYIRSTGFDTYRQTKGIAV